MLVQVISLISVERRFQRLPLRGQARALPGRAGQIPAEEQDPVRSGHCRASRRCRVVSRRLSEACAGIRVRLSCRRRLRR